MLLASLPVRQWTMTSFSFVTPDSAKSFSRSSFFLHALDASPSKVVSQKIFLAPGIWPRRISSPSSPLYCLGGRASTITTPWVFNRFRTHFFSASVSPRTFPKNFLGEREGYSWVVGSFSETHFSQPPLSRTTLLWP